VVSLHASSNFQDMAFLLIVTPVAVRWFDHDANYTNVKQHSVSAPQPSNALSLAAGAAAAPMYCSWALCLPSTRTPCA
jgi:hypothetical protein